MVRCTVTVHSCTHRAGIKLVLVLTSLAPKVIIAEPVISLVADRQLMGGEVERGHFGGEKTGSLVVKYWSADYNTLCDKILW